MWNGHRSFTEELNSQHPWLSACRQGHSVSKHSLCGLQLATEFLRPQREIINSPAAIAPHAVANQSMLQLPGRALSPAAACRWPLQARTLRRCPAPQSQSTTRCAGCPVRIARTPRLPRARGPRGMGHRASGRIARRPRALPSRGPPIPRERPDRGECFGECEALRRMRSTGRRRRAGDAPHTPPPAAPVRRLGPARHGDAGWRRQTWAPGGVRHRAANVATVGQVGTGAP